MSDEKDRVQARDAEDGEDERDEAVVWTYEPDSTHAGAYLPGVPRGDLTQRTLDELGVSEDDIEASGLYKRASGVRSRVRRRSKED